MRYVECPEVYTPRKGEKSLFLAGGITGCKNWQSELVKLLEEDDLTIINPRRQTYPAEDPNIEKSQIAWEYEHLKKADAVSFWFTKESICPITLYELGKQNSQKKPIFIGIEPGYKRRSDIELQTKLARPTVRIVYSLTDLSQQIRSWTKINHRNPAATVDLIVEREGTLLLVKRARAPFKGMWALPGGFVNYGQERVEQAGTRELEEETGLRSQEKNLVLLGVYSDPDRDPRGHVISHAYAVTKYWGEVKAGDDAQDLGWFNILELPKIAFDHNKIISDYLAWRKR